MDLAVNENEKGRVISDPAFLVRESSSPIKAIYASLDVNARLYFEDKLKNYQQNILARLTISLNPDICQYKINSGFEVQVMVCEPIAVYHREPMRVLIIKAALRMLELREPKLS